MRKIPVIDMSECIDCESCIELCPDFFRRNRETCHIEVVELDEYPQKDMEEAMSMCPADCISWAHAP